VINVPPSSDANDTPSLPAPPPPKDGNSDSTVIRGLKIVMPKGAEEKEEEEQEVGFLASRNYSSVAAAGALAGEEGICDSRCPGGGRGVDGVDDEEGQDGVGVDGSEQKSLSLFFFFDVGASLTRDAILMPSSSPRAR